MENNNPFTMLNGYTVYDHSGAKVGTVEDTVYDAPTNILKYIIVDRRPVPADRLEVDAELKIINAPYSEDLIRSSPRLHELSGEFDETLHAHYEQNG